MFPQEQPIVLGRKNKAAKGRSNDFSADFEFGERDGLYSEDWAMADVMAQLKKRVSITLLPVLGRLMCQADVSSLQIQQEKLFS